MPDPLASSPPSPLLATPSRRDCLAASAALLLAPGAARAARPSLGELGAQKGLLVGASSSWEIARDPSYAALIAREAKLLVTDKALKFDWIRPKEGEFDFSEADMLLDFARRHDQLLRGHTLIWNDNPPDWLRGKSRAELIGIFDAHIARVGARFAGLLHSWDVVNEPFWPGTGLPGGFRDGPWYQAMGEDYIPRAFKRLALVDTTARFVLNEAQTERQDELGLAIRAGLLKLIDRLQQGGIRLDAIGLQAHIKPQVAFDIQAFLRFLDEIAARRLDIYLTEFDIDDANLPREEAKRDAMVAEWTHRFLGPVLQHPSVKVLVTWHLSDRYTWYREPAVAATRPRKFPARPLPFDENYREKPMAQAMRAALLAAPPR